MGETEGKREALRILEAKLERQEEEIERQRRRIEELETEVAGWRVKFDTAKREYETEIARLKREMEAMEKVYKEKKELERMLEGERLKVKRLEEDRKLSESTLQVEISRLKDEISLRERKIKELEEEVAGLEKRVSELEEEKEALKRAIASLESLIKDDINYKPYFILKSIKRCKVSDLAKSSGVLEGQMRAILARMEGKGIVKVDGNEVEISRELTVD
ncbi:MAG: hypothetical protein QW461_06135 [Candidatus Jordarchaeales archaeon]